jgi:ABC-type molybdate transport system substrate-binding protein
VDVGPVWVTETVQARAARLECEIIEPGSLLDQRDKFNYYICRLADAQHPQNAQKFIDFIVSPAAQTIYKKAGFGPHLP